MTHVLEIEAGAGDPARLTLTAGQELEPLSIGRRGTWKLEADGVLDLHAFVYFDGASLFLRAEDAALASVDGAPIATTWTELHAPCTIEIGAARLRFRSGKDASSSRKSAVPMNGPASMRRSGQPAPQMETRFAPLDPAMASIAAKPPRTVRLAPESQGTLSEDQGASSMVPTGTLMIPDEPMAPNAMMGDIPSPSAIPRPPITPSFGGSFAPSFPPQPGPPRALPSTARGSSGLADVARTSADRFKELTPAQRLLVILAPLSLLSAGYLLLFEDSSERPAQAADAGAVATVVTVSPPTLPPPVVTATLPPASAATVATAPSPPAGVACPPGFVPYSVAINGQVPCVPVGTPMPATPAPAPAPDPGQAAPAQAVRTLERQAVDLVATGNYVAAAQAYDLLHQQNPTNRVYAEAARILRGKADAGSP